MEQRFSILQISITFLIIIITLIKFLNKSKSKNLPPGPSKLPLIGNLHQLGSLPHHSLAKLSQKYGPLMHLKLGQVSTIVISSAELAKEVLKTRDLNFFDRPFLLAAGIISYDSSVVYASYGDYWRQMRKIFMVELLSNKRVQSYRSTREEEVNNLVKNILEAAGSVTNISKLVFYAINNITCNAAFSKRYSKNQQAFVDLVEEVVEVLAGFNIGDMFPSVGFLQSATGLKSKLVKLHKQLDQILETIIDEHKTVISDGRGDGENGDLVDVLLNLQKHGDLEFPLTNNNIKGIILDVFIAGSETSSSTTEWAMSELIKNPDVMKKVQAEVRRVFSKKGFVDEAGLNELTYLKLVIKEALRLHTPVPLLVPRQCREDCVINGYHIPAKSKVIINAWRLGRDPENWEDAEKFYPERFLDNNVDYKGLNFEFIPFGAGRRICPGISFGIANIELTLASLLFHFDWKLPHGMKLEDLDMVEAFGAAIKRRTSLCLIPTPYKP